MTKPKLTEDEFKAALKNVFNQIISEMAIERFLPLWKENACKNAAQLSKHPTIGAVSFKNRPAIIVGPGPSLKDNVHKLAKFKGKAVIIALNRAAQPMIAAGIIPDCVLALDAQEIVRDHLVDLPIEKTTLVLEKSVNPEIFKMPARNIFHYEGNKDLFHWFSVLFSRYSRLGSGATVGFTALALSISWQCDPIIAVGLDLAIKKYRFGDNGPAVNKKFEVDAYDGGKIGSAVDLIATRESIEYAIAATQPGPRYINCSEGGAKIKGMEQMPLLDTLEFCKESFSAMKIFDAAKSVGSLVKLRSNIKKGIESGDIPEEHWETLVNAVEFEFSKLKSIQQRLVEHRINQKMLKDNNDKQREVVRAIIGDKFPDNPCKHESPHVHHDTLKNVFHVDCVACGIHIELTAAEVEVLPAIKVKAL